jgi:beta-mannosidase
MEYLKSEELSRTSIGWQIHTNATERGALEQDINYQYGDPKSLSLPQFLLYGQMVQAILHGAVLEGLRFRKDDPNEECQGALMWSYNDTWGEIGWSIVDHYLRRKASYYWVRRAAAPIKVLIRSRDAYLVTRVVNDTLKTLRVKVNYGWMRLDGGAQEMQSRSLTVPANGMIEVAREPFPKAAQRSSREWLYAAILTGKAIEQDQAIWLLAPHRELELAQPRIMVSIQEGVLVVQSPTYCHGVHLEDGGREVLADNYFDLLPYLPRRIPVTAPRPSGNYPLTAILPI